MANPTLHLLFIRLALFGEIRLGALPPLSQITPFVIHAPLTNTQVTALPSLVRVGLVQMN